jgi:hypothetical protein
MNTATRTSAEPTRTVMFRPICSYCGKNESYYANCDFQLSVIACDDPQHRAMADRDAKAWLHRNHFVRPQHYKGDPLFQQTNLLKEDVQVKRSSGAIDKIGWTIRAPGFNDTAMVSFIDGAWAIPVINNEELIQKYIHVQELKMSLPEDKHPLVDMFEARLQVGFYIAEANAYDKVLLAERKNENPYVDAQYQEDNIVTIFHPVYGVGRVFDPQNVADPAYP